VSSGSSARFAADRLVMAFPDGGYMAI